ncbi:MAG: pilus assembly protein [Lachnospiraceae bacterium]|nr:pilus assembly protein [Lachnospiraceae bacterium]
MQAISKYFKAAFSQKSIKKIGIRISSSETNGSMTIEAAMVMPIFIFFIVSLLYIFQIIIVQTETLQDLHQHGNRRMFEAYQHRDRYDDAILELTESYHIKPYLLWQDFGRLRVVQKYYGHVWVGFDLSRNTDSNYNDKEYVYIALTGTVFHMSMNCSHLKLSVINVDGRTISSLRNDSGAKYYRCERCPTESGDVLYVTSFGTRYHSDVNCSGLKRTVSIVSMEEAVSRGYRGCSRCGV